MCVSSCLGRNLQQREGVEETIITYLIGVWLVVLIVGGSLQSPHLARPSLLMFRVVDTCHHGVHLQIYMCRRCSAHTFARTRLFFPKSICVIQWLCTSFSSPAASLASAF